MNDPHSPSLHSWTPNPGQGSFPGIDGGFSGPPAVIDETAFPVQAAAPATKSSLPFNLSNLGDLKAVFDRMGGVEGVLSTMGKVQKFMSTMQQMAPMIKLFMGKGGKAATANAGKGSSRRRTNRRPPPRGRTRRRKPAKRR
ncbi:aminotransferase [Cohnella cellulosilytica]|uniref:Aminotransferase n=1 Tax=Cohnella cellulosilytica TaxID=986710 RepID=A0ABW2FEV3_9BACL